MWALNTLGRLCFDHAANAAKVCASKVTATTWQYVFLFIRRCGVQVIDSAVANILGMDSVDSNQMDVVADVALALEAHDSSRLRDKSAVCC